MKLFAKAIWSLRRTPRLRRIITDSQGLINTTDLLVATGATVILAAGVGSAALSTLNDAKYGKAQPDAQSVANAISQFYKDTGKWPGQAEQAALTPSTVVSGVGGGVKAQFLVTAGTTDSDADKAVRPIDFDTPPDDVTYENGTAISVAAATCQNNSLEGFVGKKIDAGKLSSANLLNVNNFLVRKPADASYSNWKGPYLQEDIKTDPWDRAWVFNLQPLYCSESIDITKTSTAGSLGYAWALSGGANRTITTGLNQTHLDPTGDDTGVSLGKLITRGTGGADSK
ncbi:MAG: type II secretion system protein GspG [Acidobacteria bacterium]|nr:type II secretion system protein GspG [Acidobacteriota bacterium]